METKILDVLLQYYRHLAPAGAGLLFLTMVNKEFRKTFFQTVNTMILVVGIFIAYAVLTNQPSNLDLVKKAVTVQVGPERAAMAFAPRP